jgi:hypothetical protein
MISLKWISWIKEYRRPRFRIRIRIRGNLRCLVPLNDFMALGENLGYDILKGIRHEFFFKI